MITYNIYRLFVYNPVRRQHLGNQLSKDKGKDKQPHLLGLFVKSKVGFYLNLDLYLILQCTNIYT